MSSLEDRMLSYEDREARRTFLPRLPILVRLDGRSFHKVTRRCDRPFDAGFHSLMVAVAKTLAGETTAPCAYVQSDEITLALWYDNRDAEPYFGGRVQKIVSSLAGMASAEFNAVGGGYMDALSPIPAALDCRAWQVPSLEEAANVLIWREQDASRNSVQMAARAVFSHKQCHGKNAGQLQEMLHEDKGINWNDYPDWSKRGTYLIRRKVSRALTAAEIARIPKEHLPENGVVERHEHVEEHPRLAGVSNRVAYLFEGADAEVTNE